MCVCVCKCVFIYSHDKHKHLCLSTLDGRVGEGLGITVVDASVLHTLVPRNLGAHQFLTCEKHQSEDCK